MGSGHIGSPIVWVGFSALIVVLLALDLGLFRRGAQKVRTRTALVWSGVWIGAALAFNLWIYLTHGAKPALEFLTGYVLEKSLSIDNLFVFVLIFSIFAVPPKLQHRVLFWGVVGALVMRAGLIVAGGALLAALHWATYVFGAVLAVSGLKLLLSRGTEPQPDRNPLFRLFRRVVPSVDSYDGARFITRSGGKRLATRLLLVLVAVEVSDLVFAVDSIPAVLGVSRDPFIVITSNVFAILGLRSLYFVVARAVGKLRHLQLGLALVLLFIGAKMLLAGVITVPTTVSLAVVGALITASIAASLLWPGPAEIVPRD